MNNPVSKAQISALDYKYEIGSSFRYNLSARHKPTYKTAKTNFTLIEKHGYDDN
jgi:hypothetical protein